MGTFASILYVLIGLAMCWFTYRQIKNHPEWFTRENLSKSFGSMGVLALVLIAIVGLCVLALKM